LGKSGCSARQPACYERLQAQPDSAKNDKRYFILSEAKKRQDRPKQNKRHPPVVGHSQSFGERTEKAAAGWLEEDAMEMLSYSDKAIRPNATCGRTSPTNSRKDDI
jgi:hypothetical protein